MGDGSRSPVNLKFEFKDRYIEIEGGKELHTTLSTIEKLSDNSFIRAIEQLFFAIAQSLGLEDSNYSLAKFTIEPINQQQQQQVVYYIINEKAFDLRKDLEDREKGILNKIIKSSNINGEKQYIIKSSYIPDPDPDVSLSENEKLLLKDVKNALSSLSSLLENLEKNFQSLKKSPLQNKITLFKELKEKLSTIQTKIEKRQISFSQETFNSLEAIKNKIQEFEEKLFSYLEQSKELQANIEKYENQKNLIVEIESSIKNLEESTTTLPKEIKELLSIYDEMTKNNTTIKELKGKIVENNAKGSENSSEDETKLRELRSQLNDKSKELSSIDILINNLNKAYEDKSNPNYLSSKNTLSQRKEELLNEINDINNELNAIRKKLEKIALHKTDNCQKDYTEMNKELQKKIDNLKNENSNLKQKIDTSSWEKLKEIHEKNLEKEKLMTEKEKLDTNGFISSKLDEFKTELRTLNNNINSQQEALISTLNKFIYSFSSSPKTTQ